MRNYSFIIIVLSLTVLSSFSTEEITIEKTWVFDSFNRTNETIIYKSKREFSKNKKGIQFLSSGKIKVKQGTSWCGTFSQGEKIDWEIVDGSWTISTDSIIVINHPLWGQNSTERMKIIELKKNQLIVKPLD